MKIEIRVNLFLETFDDKTKFQTEVLRIILSDEKWNIYYIGLTSDIEKKPKNRLFKKVNGVKSITQWNELLNKLNYPEYITIMWVRKTNKCTYVKRNSKSIYVGEESDDNN